MFETPPSPPPGGRWIYQIILPAAQDYLFLATGALAALTDEYEWNEVGIPPADAAEIFSEVMMTWRRAVSMVGVIVPVARDGLPDGLLLCDGASHLAADYPELYAVLPAAYILDADTFKTPDLSGRTVIGAGTGGGLTPRNVADIGGAETHVITTDQMPSHTHADLGHTHPVPTSAGSVPVLAPGEVPVALPDFPLGASGPGNANLESVGGGQAMPTMPPFVALSWAIIAKDAV